MNHWAPSENLLYALELLAESSEGDHDRNAEEALTRLSDYLDTAEMQERQATFRWLADQVSTLSITGNCWLAVYLGAHVESGEVDASLASAKVLSAFKELVDALYPHAEKIESEKLDTLDDSARQWLNCDELIGSAVATHLANDSGALKTLLADTALLKKLQKLTLASASCSFVQGLVTLENGSLVVVDPKEHRGFVATYSNLNNCFHLFSLLQANLPADWRPQKARLFQQVADAAHGKVFPEPQMADHAWFHYGHPGFGETDILASTVWGEANPKSIQSVDGQQVLVLWPKSVGRSWDAGFFGPQLEVSKPGFIIERLLSDQEVSEWLNRAKPSHRPRFKLGFGRF